MMWKLLLILSLCLSHGIATSSLENGNSRVASTSNILPIEELIDASVAESDTSLVTMPSNKEIVLITEMKPDEIRNTFEDPQDFVKNEWNNKQLHENETVEDSQLTNVSDSQLPFNGEAASITEITHEEVLNTSEEQDFVKNEWRNKLLHENETIASLNSEYDVGLSKNSSKENETNENIKSTEASDNLDVTSKSMENSSSSFQGDNLTTISYGVSEQSLITDLDKISRQSNFNSNVELQTSTVSQKIETIPEYSITGSIPPKYPENEENPLSDITLSLFSNEKKLNNLESLFTTINLKPLTTTKENIPNLDAKISRENKSISIDDPSTNSASYTPENSEGYSFVTKVPEISNVSKQPLKQFPETETTSEDTTSVIAAGRNFTNERNSFPTLITTQKNFIISELLTRDEKETNSSQLTTNESFVAYTEHVESFHVDTSTEENILNYFISTTNKSTFAENSPINVSSISLDKHGSNSSFIPDEFIPKILPNITSPTQENFEEVSFVSTPDASKQNISYYATESTDPPSSVQPLNQRYKLILTRNCSEDVLSSHTFQSLSEILNRRLNAKNTTEFLKCVSAYEFNFTSDIASLELLQDAIHIMQETIDSDLEISIINYVSIVHQIPINTHVNSAHFVIPKMVVYISTATTILIILFMIFVVLCLRKRCKKNSSSLDLSDFPHVALSVEDYKVAPIPRPSVTFPESNRDFLYAYSNETYNRTQDEGNILIQRHISNVIEKEYEVIKSQKEAPKPVEMQTFNRKGVGRNRTDSRSAPDYDYASAGYWDRLKCRGFSKKDGVDNPAMRW